ncbi:MAG: lamin tail domain-containing protein [Ilumatobacter sp.]|uniref:lamin tail domain-containing protein n=1 Tax=Ilumatobacter sp. TaxID=1967498 RepID=UPI00391B1940
MRRALVAVVAVVLTAIPVIDSAEPAHAALQEWNATVVSVIDGDTFWADVDGSAGPVQIRVGGLQTNEKDGVFGGTECMADEATLGLTELLDGKRVVLKARRASSQSLGRPIRHVFVDGVNVAQPMLRRGLGVPVVFNEEPDFAVSNANAALLAARDEVGVWVDDVCGAGPAAGAVIDMVTNYDAAFDDYTNVNGEYVQLRNRGTEPVSLNGWTLRDTALRRFDLPKGYVLEPGDRIRIFVGRGFNTDDSIYLGSDKPLFGNDADGVFLHDPDFDIRAFSLWPCTETCKPPPLLKITHVNYDAPGDDRVNPNGEFVVITNESAAVIDFQDWMIDLPRFQLTSIASRELSPGESLTVFMGSGVNTRTSMYLGQTGGVLSNSNHIVVLYTPERTVASCDARGASVCPPVVSVTDPNAPKSAVRLGGAYRV